MMKNVGLIGLGNIGGTYIEKFISAGYPLSVLDLDAEKVGAAVRLGAKAAATPAEITRCSDFIVLSLPNSEIVDYIMSGKDGVLSALREGQVVIDTSSCRPQIAVKYEKLCNEKGAGFIDAPLTLRGEKGQIMMAGGNEDVYKKSEEILNCISYKCKLVGPSGMGQYLKMVNQAYLGCYLAVKIESVELAKKFGLDPKLINDFLELPVDDSIYTGDYGNGGNLIIHYKDLGYLLEAAHDAEAQTPIAGVVHEMFKAAKHYGKDPNWRQVGIHSYYKMLNDETINNE